MTDIEFYKTLIEKRGIAGQCVIAMEECSELIQAISKLYRGEKDTDHLTEEMADVIIMLNQLKIMFGISNNEIKRVIQNKITRTAQRMEIDTKGQIENELSVI